MFQSTSGRIYISACVTWNRNRSRTYHRRRFHHFRRLRTVHLPVETTKSSDRNLRRQRSAGHGRLRGGKAIGVTYSGGSIRGRIRRCADCRIPWPGADHRTAAAPRYGKGRRTNAGRGAVHRRRNPTAHHHADIASGTQQHTATRGLISGANLTGTTGGRIQRS